MGERLIAREYKVPAWDWPSLSFSVPLRRRGAVSVDQPAGCPLRLTVANRHWSVRWSGFSLGAWPRLELTLTNLSPHAVSSFSLRYLTGAGGPANAAGTHPERGLSAGATISDTSQEPDTGCTAVRVDFVQFIGGDTWLSGDPQSLVTEAGVQAGARAALRHLRTVRERFDVDTAMQQLGRLHVDVTGPPTNRVNVFGFYNGVENTAVRLRHAYERDGPNGVEVLLLEELGTPPCD